MALPVGAAAGLAAVPGTRGAGLRAAVASLQPADASLGAALDPDQQPLAGILPHGPAASSLLVGPPTSSTLGPSLTPPPLHSTSCCGNAVPHRASLHEQPPRGPIPLPPADLVGTGHRHRYHTGGHGGFPRPRAHCDPHPTTRARHSPPRWQLLNISSSGTLRSPHQTPTFEAPLATGLDADHIAALHAQAAGLHNIRSLVSIILDLVSSHYPRWRGQVLHTLWCYTLDDHVLDDVVPRRPWLGP
jgi:hypothetical protein